MPAVDHLAFGDESGDHGLSNVSPHFPIFVLVICLFDRDEYVRTVVPSFRELKLKYFGTDQVVLHGRDIRRGEGPFGGMGGAHRQSAFRGELADLVVASPFHIAAAAVDKRSVSPNRVPDLDMYPLCLNRSLGVVRDHLVAQGRGTSQVTLRVEARNRPQNRALRRSFEAAWTTPERPEHPEFQLAFARKIDLFTGIEIADQVAHPIARTLLEIPDTYLPFDALIDKIIPHGRAPAQFLIDVLAEQSGGPDS